MDWKEKGVGGVGLEGGGVGWKGEGWGWKGEGWGWKGEGFRQYRRVLKKLIMTVQ